MKKHKNRGKIILSLLSILVFITYANVNAAEDNTKKETKIDCSGWEDETKKKECEANATQCITELNAANYQFITKLSNDQKTITYEITSSKSVKAVYKVEIKIVLDNNVVKNEVFENVEGNKKYTYTVPAVDKNKEYFVNLVATVNSSNTYNKIDCSQYYRGTSIFSIGNVTSDEFDNPYIAADGICTQYKNGTLDYDDAKKHPYSSIKDLTINVEGKTITGAQYFDQLLPYCSKAKIEYLIPESELTKQIVSAAQIVTTTSKISSAGIINIDTTGYTKTDKLKLDFYCDAFGTRNGDYYVPTLNTRKFYYEKKLPDVEAEYKDSYEDSNGNLVKKTTVCGVKCVEKVEATYGPPVAVKGNICFEYEITVKSKSVCNAEFNKNVVVPKKKEYKLCNPVPVCNQASSLYRNQAGPNEDFDQCVMELDGGKYKQSTINKCYNKVYKKKKTIKKQSANLALEYQPVQKIANSSMPDYCNTSKFGSLNATSVAQSVYEMYTKKGYQGGYYEKVNGKIEWKSCNSNSKACKDKGIKFIDGCYWNDYSRYYTASSLSYTQRTVMDDQYFYQANSGYRWWDYRSTYYKPKDGFKTAYYGSSSNPCNDKCVYTTSNCQSDKYNPGDTTAAGEHYKEDLDAYESAIDKCNQQIACTTDKVTKYTMSVNHSTGEIKVCDPSQKDGDNKDCKVWATTNAKNHKVTNIKDKILKNASGICYGDDKKDTDYQYVNIISFPGSWIRNKDGSVRYGFNDGTKTTGYTLHENQYCVSPKAGNVNEKWWNWDQLGGRLGVNLYYIGVGELADPTRENLYRKYTDDLGVEYFKLVNSTNRGGKDDTNGYYNIFGNISDFGYFNWDLSFSCFYAVNNNGGGTTTTTTTPTSCTDEKCKTNGLKNSDTRTIDLSDPFPTAEKTSTKISEDEIVPKKLNNTATEEKATKVADSSVSRTPGFNWSCDATNLGIEGYTIAPTALTAKIRSDGSSIYDNSKELDYEIDLTTENIKQIRSYNKEEGHDYFNFYGKNTSVDFKGKDNAEKKYKINFYTSSFLNQSEYAKIIKRPTSNCNNYFDGQCDNLDIWVEKEKTNGACPKLGEV